MLTMLLVLGSASHHTLAESIDVKSTNGVKSCILHLCFKLKRLERLAKQRTHEVIIDRDFVNQRFAKHVGAKLLDRVLVNQLVMVLDELDDVMWS